MQRLLVSIRIIQAPGGATQVFRSIFRISRMIQDVIIGDVVALGKGTLPAKPRDGVVPTLEIADLSGKCSGG